MTVTKQEIYRYILGTDKESGNNYNIFKILYASVKMVKTVHMIYLFIYVQDILK